MSSYQLLSLPLNQSCFCKIKWCINSGFLKFIDYNISPQPMFIKIVFSTEILLFRHRKQIIRKQDVYILDSWLATVNVKFLSSQLI